MMSLSVLFANDDVLTHWIMTEVLEAAGCVVVGACRGKEVIDLLADAPEFDVLLADLDIADTSRGFDIGHHWRHALPGRPVIYTGASREALTHKLAPHEYFLPSPFSAALLLRTIDAALEEASFQPMLPAESGRFDHVH